MTTTTHHTFQNHRNVGFNRKNKPNAIASVNETHQINTAIVALNKAKSVKTEREFVELVSQAFNNCRTICRGRIL